VNKENRQFKRWEVSIPCTVTHMGETIRGRVANISLGGAFITELTTAPPPEKAFITVTFQVEQEEVEINSSVDSIVVRNLFDIRDDEIVGSIGVTFQDQSKTGQSRLVAIMRLIVRLQRERDMLASRLKES